MASARELASRVRQLEKQLAVRERQIEVLKKPLGSLAKPRGTVRDEAIHDPNGLSPLKSLQMRRLNRSVRRILSLLYPFAGMIMIADRNFLIMRRFEEGELISDIAVDFDISPQRVWQIVRDTKRSPK